VSSFHLDAEHVESLARQLFGAPNQRLSTAREVRFGRRGSVAVIPSRGVFRDYEAGVSGGVLAMLVHAGVANTTAEAARLLENAGAIPVRETNQDRDERELRERAARESRRAVAASLWSTAGPLTGSPAERYLRTARAVGASLGGAAIRFLPDAPLNPYSARSDERRPAMVAAVVDASGVLTGAHLTFLAADGGGKAPDLSPARKMVGTVGGGFVPLAAGSRLVVAEGIESALSAWDAIGGPAQGFGCVAALSAGGVAALNWPATVRDLIIAPDRDPSDAGERAAQALAQRAWGSGLVVAFLRPPAGFSDWNDAAQAERVRS
jgi:hypothetical protein